MTEIRRMLAMTNAVVLAGSIVPVFFILDVIFGLYAVLPVISISFGAFALTFYLILKGYFDTSKFILLIFASTTHFISASSKGPDAGNLLIYFPLFCSTFLFFDRSKFWQILLISVYFSLQIFWLELTDYNLFDIGVPITNTYNHISYYFILSISILLCMLFIHELIEINRASQTKMLVLNKKLRKRNKNLVKANEELDNFVYRASHDLRSPLRSILGLASIMRTESNIANMPELIDKLEKSAKRLDTYVLDILDMSRNVKSGIEAIEIPLDTFLRDIFGKLEYMMVGKRIEFNLKCEGAPFYSDPSRLQIVFSNLMGNSIKYSKIDTDEVCVLNLDVTVDESKALFVLEDNGQGISKEALPKIFEMFYRANEQSDGSGLGLYIVKEVVERLNGEIRMESEKGEWTKVYLTIPNLSKLSINT